MAELQSRATPEQKQLKQPCGFCSVRPKCPSRHWSQRSPWQLAYSYRYFLTKHRNSYVLIISRIPCKNKNVRRGSRDGEIHEDRRNRLVGDHHQVGNHWKYPMWHHQCIHLRRVRIRHRSYDHGSSCKRQSLGHIRSNGRYSYKVRKVPSRRPGRNECIQCRSLRMKDLCSRADMSTVPQQRLESGRCYALRQCPSRLQTTFKK